MYSIVYESILFYDADFFHSFCFLAVLFVFHGALLSFGE